MGGCHKKKLSCIGSIGSQFFHKKIKIAQQKRGSNQRLQNKKKLLGIKKNNVSILIIIEI
jgi:hypothetical protein